MRIHPRDRKNPRDAESRPVKHNQWLQRGNFQARSGRLLIVDPAFVGDEQMSLTVPFATGDQVCVRVKIFDDPEWGRVIGKVLFSAGPEFSVPNEVVGRVWVDSASLVVFDPLFLPKWKSGSTAKARSGSTFMDREGVHWHCALHGQPPPIFAGRSFLRFDDPIPDLGGKSMNELRDSGAIRENHWTINGDEFSREGAFATRTGPDDSGFLNIDQNAAAFTFTSGYGDGAYEVRADGKSVLIDLLDPASE